MDEPDWKGALGEAFERAVAYLGGLPDRPVGSAATLEQLRAALGGPLPDAPRDAAGGGRGAGRGRRAGGGGVGERTVLRVRGRRRDPGGAGRRLADVGVGPERGALRPRPRPPPSSRRSRAGGWPTCSGCPPQVSVGFVTGAQMANVTGLAAALHRRAAAGRAGTWRRRGCGGLRRSGCSPASSGTAPSTARCASSASARPRSVPVAADEQGRMRVDALARALDGGNGPGDRVRAGRQRQHRRGRTRWARSATSRTGTARGCTSTARSGCGPRRARGCGSWWRAWSAPTRGRPTRTSGSTSPTTPDWCSARTRAAHRAAMGIRAGYLVHGAAGGARRAGPQPRALPPGPRLPRVRRAAGARPQRGRRRWSSAAARWPGGSPSSWTRPRASTSSTTSCSTRCSSASAGRRRRSPAR